MSERASEPVPGEPPDAEPTFADVVNGLTLGSGRRKRTRSTVDDAPPAEAAGDGARQPVTRFVDRKPPWIADELVDPSDDASIVRPYAWTQGRTKSIVDLRIETMVSTSEQGENVEALTQTEHRSIAGLCREPRSVAEVATMLNVPLGVAKVLLGDMAGLGLVIVHKTATGGANKAHLMLMERVLSGLRRL